MPCLSRSFEFHVGPLIPIGVSAPGTLPGSPHQIVTVAALIDTGAERTCIAPSVAEAAQIQPIGKTPMRSATHVIDANVYLIDLLIHLKTIVQIPGLTVVEFAQPPEGASFQAVLGRDVLCKGSFSMVNGRYKLCL